MHLLQVESHLAHGVKMQSLEAHCICVIANVERLVILDSLDQVSHALLLDGQTFIILACNLFFMGIKLSCCFIFLIDSRLRSECAKRAKFAKLFSNSFPKLCLDLCLSLLDSKSFFELFLF